jgi:hypothetical protein
LHPVRQSAVSNSIALNNASDKVFCRCASFHLLRLFAPFDRFAHGPAAQICWFHAGSFAVFFSQPV